MILSALIQIDLAVEGIARYWTRRLEAARCAANVATSQFVERAGLSKKQMRIRLRWAARYLILAACTTVLGVPGVAVGSSSLFAVTTLLAIGVVAWSAGALFVFAALLGHEE
ncbi:MAG: hypothetical protein C5B46_06095 [Proteobacteria bacterium]|nr:MAG: hypothetical protein C5B46_06095 [Pseudomonadota bacterium]